MVHHSVLETATMTYEHSMATIGFRDFLVHAFPSTLWTTWEAIVFAITLIGCFWQLFRDPHFAVDKTLLVDVGRVGLIVQIVGSMGGLEDAYTSYEAHPLFVLFGSGTAIIQASLFFRALFGHVAPPRSKSARQFVELRKDYW